jgi:hypothetical protein
MEAGNASDAISVEKIQNQSCHRNKCEKTYCTNRKLISVSYTHGVTYLGYLNILPVPLNAAVNN